MRKTILAAVVVPLIAALTAQAAAASEPHHARAKHRAAAWKQIRNSNAYAPPAAAYAEPGYPAASDFKAEQSYWTNYANGYMAGGY